MEALDALKAIAEQLLDRQKNPENQPPERGLLDRILGNNPNPETAREAQETADQSHQERGNFWSEAGRSFFLRQFPRLAALSDVSKFVGLRPEDAEVVPWQHEFEYISAFFLLIPGTEWKKMFTDPIAHSEIFQTIVAHWPLIEGVNLPLIGPNGSLLDKIKAGDPNAVIEALRVIHQDVFVTGKVGISKLWDIVRQFGGSTISGLLGGGGETPALAN